MLVASGSKLFKPQENNYSRSFGQLTKLSTAPANTPLVGAVFCHDGTMVTSHHESHFSVVNQYGLYVPDEPYTASELSALSYHGVLRPQFGPYYVDIDCPDTASQRAKSVRMVGEQLLEGNWTATLMTAAWIHLGGQAPEMFEAATATSHRLTARASLMPAALRHLDYLQRFEIDEDDLRVIGGIVVTSPELTVEDLLRIGGTQRHLTKARELCAVVDTAALEQRFIDHAKLPGMEKAHELLHELLQSLVTAA